MCRKYVFQEVLVTGLASSLKYLVKAKDQKWLVLYLRSRHRVLSCDQSTLMGHSMFRNVLAFYRYIDWPAPISNYSEMGTLFFNRCQPQYQWYQPTRPSLTDEKLKQITADVGIIVSERRQD